MNNTLQQLRLLIDTIPAKIRAMNPLDLEYKQRSDKWSKKQILGHLVDSALNNHQRFIRIQYDDTPTVVYNQNEWNALNHYQELETEYILNLWTILNQQIIEVIQRIPSESLQRTCNTGLDAPVTLAFLIDDYVAHMEYHLKQILTN